MKKIKILSGLLLLAIIVFLIYFLIQRKDVNQQINPTLVQEDSDQARPNIPEGQPGENLTKKNISVPIYYETALLEDINKNILQWSQSKNNQYLEDALILTFKNRDNETSFEPWAEQVQKNSSQILLLLSKDSSIETLTSAYTIYEWFIQLSGQYEKLIPEKKQSISRDFMQIQIYINSK